MVTHNNSQIRLGGISQSLMTGASTTSSESLGKKSGNIKNCFSCGLTTHLIKDCPYPMLPGKDKETHRSDSAASVITPENETKMIL